MKMYDELQRRRRGGRFADLIDRDKAASLAAERPKIACASYKVLQEYCWQQELNPRRVTWLHEVQHLRGLRGKVTLVLSPHDFPPGFMSFLDVLEKDGLIEIEHDAVRPAGS